MGRQVKKEEHNSGYIDLTSGSAGWDSRSRAYNRITKSWKGGSSSIRTNDRKLLGYIMLGVILSGLLTVIILSSMNSSFEFLGKPITGKSITTYGISRMKKAGVNLWVIK